MELASRRQRINPRALAGKIIFINGIIFLVICVLLGGFALVSDANTTSTHGNTVSMVLLLIAVIFGGIGLLEAMVGMTLWVLPGRASPAASLVNQYFTALENQDYETAFQCLDPFMGSPLGQTISQTEFIERAQAYDTEHGRITGYSLAGVQANPSRRIYTIKVTRGNGAYRTRLRLIGQGYNWKIVSFDRF